MTESQFYDYAVSKKITLCKRGWPDYACFLPDGKLVCVEIKSKRSHRLKVDQLRILQAMAQAGIPCYRWSPDKGFDRIMPPSPDIPTT